jgi:predicted ATPase/DNA-binding SARP family transcriptional activator
MRLRFLGPATAVVGGVEVSVGGGRRRAVLARLALEPGRSVSAERLLEDVWGDDAPAGGAGVVRFQVSRLRDVLDPERSGQGEVVLTDSAGYRLALSANEIDVHRLPRLVADARGAMGDDPRKAVELARDALALRRGAPFADVRQRPHIADEVRRLEEVLLLAERTLLEARLALGEHEDVVPALEGLAAAHPFDEGVATSLMTALGRAGRTADALAVHARLREALVDELGIDPSPAVDAVFRSLLDGGLPAHAPERPGVAPSVVVAGPADGGDVGIGGRRGNLTEPRSSFVGRDVEVAALVDAARSARLVTVVGPGGAGKTRLAQHAAPLVADRRVGAEAWFVPLVGVTDPGLVADAVAAALGVRAGEGGSALDVLRTMVRTREMLLVVDNAEHVLDAAAELVDELLDAGPRLVVLVTSRHPLDLTGEHVLRLGPLPVEPDPEVPGRPSDAARLFRERADAARPGWDDGPDADTLVDDACRRLDGVALGIELAAARLRSMGLPALVERLASSLEVVSGGRRRPPRHRTLAATLAWSMDLLDADVARLHERLSAFVGGFDRAGAAALAGGVPDVVLDDLLRELVEASLLETSTDEDGGLRFRQLEPVRQDAAARLAARGDTAEVDALHADHVVALARTAVPHLDGDDQARWSRRLTRETDDVHHALATLRATGRIDEYLETCFHLFRYWDWSGFHVRGIGFLEKVLDDPAHTALATPPWLMRGWFARSALATGLGRPSAIDAGEAGLAVAEELGDVHARGWMHMALGMAWGNTSDRYDVAREHLVDGERLHDEHGHGDWFSPLWSRAYACAIHGPFRQLDPLDVAVAYHREGQRLMRELGDEGYLGIVLGMAQMHVGRAEDEEVVRWIRSSVEECLEIGRRRPELRQVLAHGLYYFGAFEVEQGHPEAAEPLLAEAAALLADVGDALCVLGSGTRLAACRIDLGDLRGAAVALRRAVDGAPRPLPDVGGAVTAVVAAAHLAAAAGDGAASVLHAEATARLAGMDRPGPVPEGVLARAASAMASRGDAPLEAADVTLLDEDALLSAIGELADRIAG